MTNHGTKRTAKSKQPTVKKKPNTQLINPSTLKQPAILTRPNILPQQPANYQNIPQLTYNPSQNIPQQTQNNQPSMNEVLANTQGIPLNILRQAFPGQFN